MLHLVAALTVPPAVYLSGALGGAPSLAERGLSAAMFLLGILTGALRAARG